MHQEKENVDIMAEMLGFLVAEGNYTYVDKVGQAPSSDFLIFYLQEALRDFHSLTRGELRNVDRESLEKFIDRIKGGEVDLDKALDEIAKTVRGCPKNLREVCSLLSAKALAKSLKFIRGEEKQEGGKEERKHDVH
jgi:CRISPR type I-A-associated protein Csa5